MTGTPWTPSDEALSETRRLVNALVTERNAPGAAWGVFSREGLVAAGGVGVSAVGGGAPASSTVFRTASISKSFTAAAVAILADEGALSLGDPAIDYLPELATTHPHSPDSPPITIEHLLSHTSGLPKDDPWADRLESLSHAQLLEILTPGLRTVQAPGVAFEYSNLAYALLGVVVERASGTGFRDFAHRRLLEPLHLTRTCYDYTQVPASLRATGYHERAGRWVPEAFTGPGAFSPIGGVLSNVEDLAVWAGWLASAFPPADDAGPSPLSRAWRRRMQTARIDIAPILRRGSSRGWLTVAEGPAISSYALGLVVDHDPVWGNIAQHSGGYPGFGTHMRWHLDSGIGVIVLANGRGARASAVGERVGRVMLADAGAVGRTVRLWPETEAALMAISQALADGDDPFDLPLYSENVPMDRPWKQRREDLAAALKRTGPVISCAAVPVTAESAAHVVWTLPAARGAALRCEIRLTPQASPRVQTLNLHAEVSLPANDLLVTTPRHRIAP